MYKNIIYIRTTTQNLEKEAVGVKLKCNITSFKKIHFLSNNRWQTRWVINGVWATTWWECVPTMCYATAHNLSHSSIIT